VRADFRERVIKAREDGREAVKIIGEFEPLIKKCIRMYLKDPNSFEDAMQEGRIAILTCIRNYDITSPAYFEGYVKMAVIYSIRNFASKSKESMSLDEETEDGRDFHDILDSGMDIEEDAIRKERRDLLKAALDKLTEGERKVIDEFYFEGKSMREISRSRRCHYMTVVKHKEKALERLRREMGVEGDGF
jgi:RNA polymerase sporulation-specific sigma factor